MDPRKVFLHHLVLNPQAQALLPGAVCPSGTVLTQEILAMLNLATSLNAPALQRTPIPVPVPVPGLHPQNNNFGHLPHLTLPLQPFLPNLSPLPPFPPSPMLGSPPINLTPFSPMVWLPDPAPPDYGTPDPPRTTVIQAIRALEPLDQNCDSSEQIDVLERLFSIKSQIRAKQSRHLSEKLKMEPEEIQDWYTMKRKQLKALAKNLVAKAPQFATQDVHNAIQALQSLPPPKKAWNEGISDAQKAALNQIFKLRPHLDTLECSELAAKISMSEGNIFDYFLKKRDRMRRNGLAVPKAPQKCGDSFLTAEQHRVLVAAFEKSTEIGIRRQEELADRLGSWFCGKDVYRWFQTEKYRRKKKKVTVIY